MLIVIIFTICINNYTDEDLDTFNLLKDIPINKQNLKEYKRTDFEIYLFFDYDGHDTMADDSILIDLILKNEETEKGKLLYKLSNDRIDKTYFRF